MPASARLVVTARDLWRRRSTVSALLRAVPDAHVLETDFRGIFLLEADREDPLALADHVSSAAAGRIGRVLAVEADVASEIEAIEAAARAVARHAVGPTDRFCFRLHKRGLHRLAEETRPLESRIGGAIWQALRERDEKDPKVDLGDPDVTISAEVLGPRTLVCVRRRAWRAAQQAAPPRAP